MKENTTEDKQKKLARMRITCWSNDPDIGDNRTLATFVDGNDVLDMEPAKSKALYWLEDLLDATNNFSLFNTLREIQVESNFNKNPPPFPDAISMPLCIVNLVLKEYGLTLEED